MMIGLQPAASASSTPYWIIGLSTSGSISLGWALVAGRKRVPSPAAGNTALQTFIIGCLRERLNCFRCGFRSKRRAIVPKHSFSHNFQWNAALLHEFIVKIQQAEIFPLFFAIVLSQLEDLQLAERVDEISRIGRSTLSFNVSHRRQLVPLFDKKVFCLV